MDNPTILVESGERRWLATAASTASVACAIECALRPVALFVVPVLGIRSLESEWLEFAILGLVLALGVGGITLRLHRRMAIYRPLGLFLTGFAVLVIAHFVFDEGTYLGLAVAVVGAAMITASHFIYRRASGDCCEIHKNVETNNG